MKPESRDLLVTVHHIEGCEANQRLARTYQAADAAQRALYEAQRRVDHDGYDKAVVVLSHPVLGDYTARLELTREPQSASLLHHLETAEAWLDTEPARRLYASFGHEPDYALSLTRDWRGLVAAALE